MSIRICGAPLVVLLNGGAHYMMTSIDHFSIKVWVYFSKQESVASSFEGIDDYRGEAE